MYQRVELGGRRTPKKKKKKEKDELRQDWQRAEHNWDVHGSVTLDDAEVVFDTAKGRKPRPEPEPIEAPEGGTVFADLISDQPRRDEPEMPRTAEEFEALAAKQAEDQLNTRVLTQSAQRSTPLWISSSLVAASYSRVAGWRLGCLWQGQRQGPRQASSSLRPFGVLCMLRQRSSS